jgi:hypothetical protein
MKQLYKALCRTIRMRNHYYKLAQREDAQQYVIDRWNLLCNKTAHIAAQLPPRAVIQLENHYLVG